MKLHYRQKNNHVLEKKKPSPGLGTISGCSASMRPELVPQHPHYKQTGAHS